MKLNHFQWERAYLEIVCSIFRSSCYHYHLGVLLPLFFSFKIFLNWNYLCNFEIWLNRQTAFDHFSTCIKPKIPL